MAKVVARKETGRLLIDFTYQGVRCREQTALPDTKENRKRVQVVVDRLLKAQADGTFTYSNFFPGSKLCERFALEAKKDQAEVVSVVDEDLVTRPINLGGSRGHAIAVTRFDRSTMAGPASRLHAISMRTALNAAGSEISYSEFALYLRRFAPANLAQQMVVTLFRRMVFNILMDNTDDHEKNHAVVFQADGSQHLAPAFDILPACQNLGYQQIGIGDEGSESTLQNAMRSHKAFRLSLQEAERHVCEVASVVDGWRSHFKQARVNDRDIEFLSASIDRPFLMEQRKGALRLG